MLCIHKQEEAKIDGFTEITDPTFHPMRKSVSV
jgi:hypothetical protein